MIDVDLAVGFLAAHSILLGLIVLRNVSGRLLGV